MKQQRQDFCVCCGAPIQTYGLGMVCYECEHNPVRHIVKSNGVKPRKQLFRKRRTGAETPHYEAQAPPVPLTAPIKKNKQ